MVTNVPGMLGDTLEVVSLTIGGTYGLNDVECFGQALLKNLERGVLAAFELLDALAHHDGEINHDGVHAQNEKRERPVHPQQHSRRAGEGQDRDEKLGDRRADEGIDGIHVGYEMRRDTTAAERLVLGHRDALEPAEQLAAHAKDHVL